MLFKFKFTSHAPNFLPLFSYYFMFAVRYVAPACSVSEEVTLNCKLIDKQLSLIISMKQITYVVISPTYRAVGWLEQADKQTDGLDFLSFFHFMHRIQLHKSGTIFLTYYFRFSQHEASTENIYTKITSDMQPARGPLWAKKIRGLEISFSTFRCIYSS